MGYYVHARHLARSREFFAKYQAMSRAGRDRYHVGSYPDFCLVDRHYTFRALPRMLYDHLQVTDTRPRASRLVVAQIAQVRASHVSTLP